MSGTDRVLIIGLDGATWDVLAPWIRDGALPHLAKLCRAGSWGKLRSSIPPITAPAWSTFMTGKQPGKHGVLHFTKLFDKDDLHSSGNEPQIADARSIQSSTWWDVLGHHNRQVGLVNVPMTYPPRPINGFMITGLLTPKSASTFTYPARLSNELADYVIDLDRFIESKPFSRGKRDTEAIAPSLSLAQEFRDMLEKRAHASLRLMSSKPWDVFMVVFTGTDRMGHYLWPYHRPADGAHEGSEARELSGAVREYYVRLDEIVGALVKGAGEDAVVFVMSDHGMGPACSKRVHWNNWLLEQGWLSPGTSKALDPDSWLRKLKLPRDKVGRILLRIPGLGKTRLVSRTATSSAVTVDPSRSKAWCVHMYNTVFGIRINAEGREKEALSKEIRRALRQVVDPETGQHIVRYVCQGNEYYHGPYAGNVPDIIAVMDGDYTPGFRVSHYSSLVTELQVHTGRGDHRMDGVFVASGPGIAANPGALPGLAIQDIAPTMLYLLGLPVPSDMDGRVLTEIIDARILDSQPARSGKPLGFWPDRDQVSFSDEAVSDQDDAVLRDRLRALGYLG